MDYRNYYKRFSKNNLPTPFWDEERNTLEYVFYENGEPRIYSELSYALEEITMAGFYYSYDCRHLTSRLENNKTVWEVVTGHVHAHSFEEVLRDLYRYPEYFSISKKDEEFYSKQELEYLRRIQKYLVFIGMKDELGPRKSVKRYRNSRYNRYKDAYTFHLGNQYIQNIIDGKINFTVKDYWPDYSKPRKFKPKELRNLFIDDEYNIRLLVEYTHSEIKTFKDVKEYFPNRKEKDDTKVVVSYFKIIESYPEGQNE